jgi:hypothetical protein
MPGFLVERRGGRGEVLELADGWALLGLPFLQREAETEPESPMLAVSEASRVTFSKGTPTASAAICAMTVCVPWPTSAPACSSTTCSIWLSPWISTRAQQFSW